MLVQGQNLIGARLKLFDRVCRSNRILVNGLWYMVFNATFKNISVISWWSVLLVEETGVPGENHIFSSQ
jgi:hypothetical protein